MGGSVTGFGKGMTSLDVCDCSCHDDGKLGAMTMHIMPCCSRCDICKLNIARGREITHKKNHEQKANNR